MTNTAQRFIARLKKLNSDSTQIATIYNKIHENNDKTILSIEQLAAIYSYILQSDYLSNSLTNLKPNSSLRFTKNKSLPRTCVILKYPDNHFELIVMPNSKLTGGEKIEQKMEGGFKCCKKAYRIDDLLDTNIQRARLRIELDNKKIDSQELILACLEREAKISQKIQSPFTYPIFLSSQYLHKRERAAIYAFSEFGENSLYDFIKAIKNNTSFITYIPGQPVPDIFLSIIKDILTGLTHIHYKHVMHEDISYRNIILDRHNRAKFIDFGGSIIADTDDLSLRNIFSDLKSRAKSLFKAPVERKNYDLPLVFTAQWVSPEKTLIYDITEEVYGVKIASKNTYPEILNIFDYKDDIWSIGMLIISLINLDTNLTDEEYINLTVNQNIFLQNLLKPQRNERVGAAKALELWNKNPSLISISYTEFLLQKGISDILLSVSHYLKSDWENAIKLLKECAEKTKKITSPNTFMSYGYKDSSVYNNAASELQKIHEQHQYRLCLVIDEVLTTIITQIPETECAKFKPQLISRLLKNIYQNSVALYGVQELELTLALNKTLSSLFTKKIHINFSSQTSIYSISDDEIDTAIGIALLEITTKYNSKLEEPTLESSSEHDHQLGCTINEILATVIITGNKEIISKFRNQLLVQLSKNIFQKSKALIGIDIHAFKADLVSSLSIIFANCKYKNFWGQLITQPITDEAIDTAINTVLMKYSATPKLILALGEETQIKILPFNKQQQTQTKLRMV